MGNEERQERDPSMQYTHIIQACSLVETANLQVKSHSTRGFFFLMGLFVASFWVAIIMDPTVIRNGH
jgi:hypothetical protein